MVKPTFCTVAVEQLRPNPWNTNQVSPANEARIRESIVRNGLFKPIIVRKVAGQGGWEIIGGQHRYEQAVELGYTEIPICDLGEISEIQAKEIGILDNSRYGADDVVGLAEILQEIGDVADLQEFLPYGEADLASIFQSTTISLDDLDIDENFDAPEEKAREQDVASERPVKTHTVMRFKLSLGDAERLTKLIAETQKHQGFTTEDDLTNAGDALIYLLGKSSSENADD